VNSENSKSLFLFQIIYHISDSLNPSYCSKQKDKIMIFLPIVHFLPQWSVASRNVMRGARCTMPREPNYWGGAPKSHKNVASTFFNAGPLLPKDLRFEHGGAKPDSCLLCHL